MAPGRTYTMQARARGVEQTRERIMTAAWDAFLTQRYEQVTLGGIAGRARVTQQTLINHFASKEGLFLAFVQLAATEIARLRGVVARSDITGTVAALLRQYEALGDANTRLAATADTIPVVAEIAVQARQQHQRWLEEIFADLLPTSEPARGRTVAALYAVTDVGTWKLLRRDLHHSPEETGVILHTLVRSVLGSATS
jgi:AcrR family transcriptional regulator